MVFSDEGLRHLVAEVGVGQVVYGTDVPFNWPVTVDLVLNAKFLSDADKEAILSGNLTKVAANRVSEMTRRTLLGGVLTAIATFARPAWARQASFRGRAAGEARRVDAIDLCWCPPGRFVMGSPRSEPERRPGEDQVEVTLTRGFWMAKYETTQGHVATRRRRVAGPADDGIAGRRRSPGRQRQLRGDRRLLPATHRTQSTQRRTSRRLGIPSADRGAMGVRVPRRNDHRDGVRRLRSAANKRTSRASRTTAASRGRH